MTRAIRVEKVKRLLYGSGLYEKPPLRLAGSTGNEDLGAGTTVTLTTADAAKVSAGDILSIVNGDPDADYALYVTAADSTTVTAIQQYLGSPTVDTINLNGTVWEHNPLVTEHEIHTAIDTIINNWLYPDLWRSASQTISSPSLSTYQDEVPATVEKINAAFQVVGSEVRSVRVGLLKNLPTALSSTGNLVTAGYIDGSACYILTEERFAESDADTYAAEYPWLDDLIVYGAAALCVDASVANTVVPYNPMPAQEQTGAADAMWRTFVQMRESARLQISRDYPNLATRH